MLGEAYQHVERLVGCSTRLAARMVRVMTVPPPRGIAASYELHFQRK